MFKEIFSFNPLSHYLCLQTNYFFFNPGLQSTFNCFFKVASKIITLIMFLLKKKPFSCYYYIVPSNYFPTAKITCMQNESNPTSVLPSVMTKWQHSPVKRPLKIYLGYQNWEKDTVRTVFDPTLKKNSFSNHTHTCANSPQSIISLPILSSKPPHWIVTFPPPFYSPITLISIFSFPFAITSLFQFLP